MFICEQCGRQTSSGEKANSKVVEVRNATYPGGYSGTEIVKEIKVCSECKQHSHVQPIGWMFK